MNKTIKCKNCELNKYYDCEIAGCCIKETQWEMEHKGDKKREQKTTRTL